LEEHHTTHFEAIPPHPLAAHTEEEAQDASNAHWLDMLKEDNTHMDDSEQVYAKAIKNSVL